MKRPAARAAAGIQKKPSKAAEQEQEVAVPLAVGGVAPISALEVASEAEASPVPSWMAEAEAAGWVAPTPTPPVSITITSPAGGRVL